MIASACLSRKGSLRVVRREFRSSSEGMVPVVEAILSRRFVDMLIGVATGAVWRCSGEKGSLGYRPKLMVDRDQESEGRGEAP